MRPAAFPFAGRCASPPSLPGCAEGMAAIACRSAEVWPLHGLAFAELCELCKVRAQAALWSFRSLRSLSRQPNEPNARMVSAVLTLVLRLWAVEEVPSSAGALGRAVMLGRCSIDHGALFLLHQ